MSRAYYSSSIMTFCNKVPDQILGEMAREHSFDLTTFQRDAWIEQSQILKDVLSDYEGNIYFEFSIPRMGKRVDAVVIIESIIVTIQRNLIHSYKPSNKIR